jgi:uncharacterized protein YkwD
MAFVVARRRGSGKDPEFARVTLVSLLCIAALTIVPAATASTSGAGQHARPHARQTRATRGCAGPNAAVGGASVKALRAAVVCLINLQRTSRRLPPLRASLQLDRSAQRWTDEMVASGAFSHGTNFGERISATGYVWRAAGENIATGFETPTSVVNAWMASTGHCQNILNPAYDNVGTGVNRRVVRGWATGSGTWTHDFALSAFRSPPSANWGPAIGCPY